MLSRARVIAVVVVVAVAPSIAAAQALATVPAWTHTVELPPPDGRTLVSDGNLALDIAVAKPAVRPSATLPADAARGLASYLAASYPTEFGLDDLHEGRTQSVYVGPASIALSTHYVLFLKRNLPHMRFRSRNPGDPLLLVLDGRTVGLVMPMVMPR
jgi:hypothetical protein